MTMPSPSSTSPATIDALEMEIQQLEEMKTSAMKRVDEVEQQREKMRKERNAAQQEVGRLQVNYQLGIRFYIMTIVSVTP